MSEQTVIVTGGAGYIGSHTCKALAAHGFRPVVYDNLTSGNRWAARYGPLEVGDILDIGRLHEVFHAHRPVAVLHFAALSLVGESVVAPALYYRTNVGGAINVLDAARLQNVRAFVFSSTCATYGEPEIVPIPETTPQRPINAYGTSKHMIEQLLPDYERCYGIGHAILRYFNAAGADPDGEIGECRRVETHLVPLALDAVLGHKPPLKLFGDDYPTPDGTAVRDYVHVSDLADAHVQALEYLLAGGTSAALNLGTGRGHSVRQVAAAVERVSRQELPWETAPRRPGDAATLFADPGRSLDLLGLTWPRSQNLDAIVETAWRWHLKMDQYGLRPDREI